MQDLFQDNNVAVETPFTSVLLHVLEAVIVVTKTNLIEKRFITQLLNAGTKELGKLTPLQIVDQETSPPPLDINAVKAHLEQVKDLPATVRQSLMNILPAPCTMQSDTAIEDLMRGLVQSDTPLNNVFQPEFFTVAPPLCPVEDELVWFDLSNPAWHKPIYDTSFGSVSASTDTNKRGKESSKNVTSTTPDSDPDDAIQPIEPGTKRFSS